MLKQLKVEGKIQAVEVGHEWLLSLQALFAEDADRTIKNSGVDGLVIGASAQDWVVNSATVFFLQQVRKNVRNGLWFDFLLHGAQIEMTIKSKSTETLNKKVERLLTSTFVLLGVQVKGADDSGQEPYEATFAGNFLRQYWFPAHMAGVHARINMR